MRCVNCQFCIASKLHPHQIDVRRKGSAGDMPTGRQDLHLMRAITISGRSTGGKLDEVPSHDDMVAIEGGTFHMGSDRHYPEEAPVHRVTVSPFWIDRTPVTNRQFRQFVKATGYVTIAEIAPDPRDYPGALPHMLKPGSLVFTPPKHAVDLSDWTQWWRFEFGASWRRLNGRIRSNQGLDDHPVVHVAYKDAEAY